MNELEALKQEFEKFVAGLREVYEARLSLVEKELRKVKQELALTKIKSGNRRVAIKEYNRHSELMRQRWHTEIAISRERQCDYLKKSNELWMLAKYCYGKLYPECILGHETWSYSKAVSLWLKEWETKIYNRPKGTDE